MGKSRIPQKTPGVSSRERTNALEEMLTVPELQLQPVVKEMMANGRKTPLKLIIVGEWLHERMVPGWAGGGASFPSEHRQEKLFLFAPSPTTTVDAAGLRQPSLKFISASRFSTAALKSEGLGLRIYWISLKVVSKTLLSPFSYWSHLNAALALSGQKSLCF